jgi:hypothetical protein
MKKTKKKVNFSLMINKPVSQIKPGDTLKTASGKEFQIIDVFNHQGRKVFKTDRFGLVYADEI